MRIILANNPGQTFLDSVFSTQHTNRTIAGSCDRSDTQQMGCTSGKIESGRTDSELVQNQIRPGSKDRLAGLSYGL
jgi:hypothetical protein